MDDRAALWTRLAVVGRTHHHRVTAVLAKQVFFGAATAHAGHILQGVFEAGIQCVLFIIRKGIGFQFGMEVGVPEDVLQAAVAQARDALFGGQGGFERQLLNCIWCEQPLEVGFIKGVREGSGSFLSDVVIGIVELNLILPTENPTVHGERC